MPGRIPAPGVHRSQSLVCLVVCSASFTSAPELYQRHNSRTTRLAQRRVRPLQRRRCRRRHQSRGFSQPRADAGSRSWPRTVDNTRSSPFGSRSSSSRTVSSAQCSRQSRSWSSSRRYRPRASAALRFSGTPDLEGQLPIPGVRHQGTGIVLEFDDADSSDGSSPGVWGTAGHQR